MHRLFSSHILYKEHEIRFFKNIRVGKTYNYSGDYLYRDVELAARSYGINVEYNAPGSKEYTDYGCFSFTAVSIIDESDESERSDPQLFDLNELAI